MRPAPLTLAWLYTPPAGSEVKCTSLVSRGPDSGVSNLWVCGWDDHNCGLCMNVIRKKSSLLE